MPTAIDLRPFAGQWVAEDRDGEVIAADKSLAELESKLIKEHGFTKETLPAIRRVPESDSTIFVL
jgi:hypothetical protein